MTQPDRAVLCCRPGDGWSVAIGGYPAQYVGPFDSIHSAYMWCVQATLLDPLQDVPDRSRLHVTTPPPTEADLIAKLPLFQEATEP